MSTSSPTIPPTIIKINKQCSGLKNIPFIPLLILMAIFLLIIPFINHWVAGAYKRQRIRSISECWRELAGILSVILFVEINLLVYVWACLADWELKVIFGVADFFLLLIITFNPQHPKKVTKDKDHQLLERPKYIPRYGETIYLDSLTEEQIKKIEKKYQIDNGIHIWLAVTLFGGILAMDWLIFASSYNPPVVEVHQWGVGIIAVAESILFFMLLTPICFNVPWKDTTSFIEWIYVILSLFQLLQCPPAVIV